MVQTSLTTKSHSYDLVRAEIDVTIRAAEQSLERFQENRQSGEDLQNCVDALNQLRGIFVLVEIRGGMLVCQEAVALANEVPVGATEEKNALLSTLVNAIFVLRRYIEYFHQQREDHPELLLPSINDLREARQEKPFPESHFLELDASRRVNCCAPLSLTKLHADKDDWILHSRRFRHMYQVALLGLLKDRDTDVSLRLLNRAAEGMARLCDDAPLAQLWCLLAIVARAWREQDLEVSKSRKRLLMRIEKYTREMVYVGRITAGKAAPDSIFRDLVHMLAMSGSTDAAVTAVLSGYKVAPAEFDEKALISHRKRLYGPGADALRSLSQAISEEVSQIKDRLDILERGVDHDQNEVENIRLAFDRISATMAALGLPKTSALAAHERDRLAAWVARGGHPGADEMMETANAVLTIEQAVKRIVEGGVTAETDERIAGEQLHEDSVALREAVIVVVDEATQALTLTKRAITAFMESNWDKMHLANVPPSLEGVWGGLVLLEEVRAAKIMKLMNRCLSDKLIETQVAPEHRVLETLADALTSMEYYIEGLTSRERPNPELLKLAEDALQAIGYQDDQ